MIGFIIVFILLYRFIFLNIGISIDQGAMLSVAIGLEIVVEIWAGILYAYIRDTYMRNKKGSVDKIV